MIAHPAHIEIVRTLITACPWLYGVLEVVRTVGSEMDLRCWVGAGAVRDLAWDTWFSVDAGRHPADFDGSRVKDLDVVYFDARRTDRELEAHLEEALARHRPDVVWDVKNQAAVHLWYRERFGATVDPLTSVSGAVGTWPETATAVAVALTPGGTIEVLAPLGLEDLIAGVHRRNPRRVSVAEYRARMERKQPAVRWPRVRVQR